MRRKVVSLLIIITVNYCSWAQTIEKGPYTVYVLGKGIWRIEDANSSRPAGLKTDQDGKIVDMNNCSDMYLVAGTKKALLIDLSNFIKWDDTAVESLRSIISERVGNKEFFITVTHKHGDHLGMLPAFRDDPEVKFWIPEAEFRSMDIFPEERTIFFPENASLDLGGDYLITTTRYRAIPIMELYSSSKARIWFLPVMLWVQGMVYGFLVMRALSSIPEVLRI